MEKLKEISKHSFCWIIYFIFNTGRVRINSPDYHIYFLDIGLFYVTVMFIFYVTSFYLYPQFHSTRKYWQLLISICLVFVVFSCIRYLLVYTFQPFLNPEESSPPFTFTFFTSNAAWIFFMYAAYGFGYYAIRREKERRLLEQENARLETEKLKAETKTALLEAENARLEAKAAQLEAEKLQAENKALHFELGFLRAQLNPHFIFNTMSAFSGRACAHDQGLAEAINRFSDILRYTLHDHTLPVTLQQEVDSIQNFIEVYQLQHGGKLVIDFAYSGNMEATLPSALLVSFVENAFKYGYITDSGHPLRISLHLKEDTLYFEACNRKRNNGIRHDSTGIGIAHTRIRLEHLYPNRFELETINAVDDFTVQLTIRQLSQPVLTTPYTFTRV